MSLEFKIAETPEEKDLCFRIRFEVYESIGRVSEKDFPDRRIIDEITKIAP